MIRLAFYGKGGIGKSTTVSNLSVAFSRMGLTVMQIGCDPKADSTISLRRGEEKRTVLSLVREKKDAFSLSDMVTCGFAGILLVEAGGPTPGLGCAGRGIINALEKLEEKGAYEVYQPDVVLYDVLGDVVCGGFTMPMRDGYADRVYIVTGGDKMSTYAAGNIALAVERFEGRGYARLGGFVLNRRGVKDEERRVQGLCADFDSEIVGDLPKSALIEEAEGLGITLMEAFPDSCEAKAYEALARRIWEETDAYKN